MRLAPPPPLAHSAPTWAALGAARTASHAGTAAAAGRCRAARGRIRTGARPPSSPPLRASLRASLRPRYGPKAATPGSCILLRVSSTQLSRSRAGPGRARQSVRAGAEQPTFRKCMTRTEYPLPPAPGRTHRACAMRRAPPCAPGPRLRRVVQGTRDSQCESRGSSAREMRHRDSHAVGADKDRADRAEQAGPPPGRRSCPGPSESPWTGSPRI